MFDGLMDGLFGSLSSKQILNGIWPTKQTFGFAMPETATEVLSSILREQHFSREDVLGTRLVDLHSFQAY